LRAKKEELGVSRWTLVFPFNRGSRLRRSPLLSLMPLPKQCLGKSRANHRSKTERAILQELGSRLSSALQICESGVGDSIATDEQRHAMAAAREVSTLPARRKTQRFSSNEPSGGAQLFYAPSTAVGVGLPQRRGALGQLHPNADPKSYGVQQLSDYARSELLGGLSDTLRPGESLPDARKRFDALLSRMQQYQLAHTIRHEVLATRCAHAALGPAPRTPMPPPHPTRPRSSSLPRTVRPAQARRDVELEQEQLAPGARRDPVAPAGRRRRLGRIHPRRSHGPPGRPRPQARDCD